MHTLKIGCSGFGGLSPAEYWKRLEVVELDQTFYAVPKRATLQRIRRQAPPGAELVVRAWQLITHEPSAPSYARLGRKLTPAEQTRYGRLQLTDEVLAAYQATLEAARLLGSRLILFETPPAFTPSAQSRLAWRRFVERVDREGVTFLWEPRGLWEPEEVQALCRELGMVAVEDPLRPTMLESAAEVQARLGRRPARKRTARAGAPAGEAGGAVERPVGLAYFRLHGLGASRRYDEAACYRLAEACAARSDDEVYVIFASADAARDATRFAALIASGGAERLEAFDEEEDEGAAELEEGAEKPSVDGDDLDEEEAAFDEDEDEDEDDDDDDDWDDEEEDEEDEDEEHEEAKEDEAEDQADRDRGADDDDDVEPPPGDVTRNGERRARRSR